MIVQDGGVLRILLLVQGMKVTVEHFTVVRLLMKTDRNPGVQYVRTEIR